MNYRMQLGTAADSLSTPGRERVGAREFEQIDGTHHLTPALSHNSIGGEGENWQQR